MVGTQSLFGSRDLLLSDAAPGSVRIGERKLKIQTHHVGPLALNAGVVQEIPETFFWFESPSGGIEKKALLCNLLLRL